MNITVLLTVLLDAFGGGMHYYADKKAYAAVI